MATWTNDRGWAFSNFDFNPSAEQWEQVVDHWMPSGMMIATLVIALLYSAVHSALIRKSQRYNVLKPDQQVVVITHAIEALVLSIVFPLFTYLILSVHFEAQDPKSFQWKGTAIGTIMFSIIIMYLIELAVRYRTQRSLVVFHHLAAFTNSILSGIFLTPANMRAASMLVYFITFEALIFVGLVMYRLCPSCKATKHVILAGMTIFAVTRPLQMVWIVGSLACVWDELILWQAVLQILLTILFTTLQMYSLIIHYQIYRKVCAFNETKRSACSEEKSPSDHLESQTSQRSIQSGDGEEEQFYIEV